jgi:hypothetical protein
MRKHADLATTDLALASGETVMPDLDPPDYLVTTEAAQMLRTPVATLYAWRQQGGGPPARKVGKRLLYRRDELIAWVNQHSTQAP